MSNRGFEFRRRESRGNPTHHNPGLAEAIAKIRAESTTPPHIPREESVPALPKKKIDKGITDADRERAKDSWHIEALRARARGQGVLDAKYSPSPLPEHKSGFDGWKERRDRRAKQKFETISEEERTRLIEAAKGNLKKHGIGEAAIAAVEKKFSGLSTRADFMQAGEAMSQGLSDREERLRKEKEEDESARKIAMQFKPALSERGIVEEEARIARLNESARKVASQFKAEFSAKKTIREKTMIEALNEWLGRDAAGKEEIRKNSEGLGERLAKQFPTQFQGKEVEISGSAHTIENSILDNTERLRQEESALGLESRAAYMRGYLRERWDVIYRTAFTKLMLGRFAAMRMLSNPKVRGVAALSPAFYFLISGLSDFSNSSSSDFGIIPDANMASADVMRFSSPHIADATPVVAGVDSPPAYELLNAQPNDLPDPVPQNEVSFPDGGVSQAVPGDHIEDAGGIAEPIEVQGDVSVWSSLLDGLGEKGIDLTERGEEAFAHAVQRAIEDTDTQSVFIEHNGTGLSGVAWDKIPDGANIHFDLLFGKIEFLDRLKEILSTSEYRTLGKELQSMGGVDGFISDVQDAFGVKYL